MSDSDLIKENERVAHRVFRFYSRKVFLAPNNRHFHEQRINAALLLTEKEPLQGAVADFFYGCWFDIPYDVNNLFTRIKDRLYPHVQQGFRECIDKKRYIQRNSMLATRWSVLISPSLNEQKQRLRISSDDAREIAKDITTELMQAREDEDWGTIEQIENEFFCPLYCAQ
ncbi:hypothetical protein JCM18901_656 [Psychrobacter sp. JCM 18901]|uniref:hypothetical protein n=1 Tax=Psychrobacter sp. JCM 18901 TaxID=1298609 RepID=UPI000435B448|nr:hypothetical protein [Psychrobacter sp. JCM 18901]GAF55038.1 hypothetical protein JCM18901_656 [Psychrobacter sp. JCM 18901]